MEALIMCGCPACTPRPPTVADKRRQEAENLRHEQAKARDEARRNQIPPTPEARPTTKGCVFAKSRDLPDGLINYSNPNGFVPVELLTQYGDFAVLGSGSANMPLAWMGGSGSATAFSRCLEGSLAMAPAGLDVLAIVLIPDTTPPDRALCTLDQYATLTNAKTRVRLNVERLADNCVRAYGFYTGKNKDWENVPLVAAKADGERFVVDLGQGIQLIRTPATTAPMPVLKDAPPLPPVWVYPPTENANKILGNPVHPPQYRDMVVWFPKSEIPPFYISLCISKTCPHPDMMEELAEYIAGEMNRNIHHPSVLKMKKLNSYDTAAETKKFLEQPWYAMAGTASPQTVGYANSAAAFSMWTERVGQNRPWDHKPKIFALFGGAARHKQGAHEYYYDIWSNIHYGYVGMAGGFTESALLDGAGGEQIVSDSVRKIVEVLFEPGKEKKLPGPNRSENVDGLRAWDDAQDRISIGIGTKLYNQYPHGGITGKIIMTEVLAVPLKDWGGGARAHVCKST